MGHQRTCPPEIQLRVCPRKRTQVGHRLTSGRVGPLQKPCQRREFAPFVGALRRCGRLENWSSLASPILNGRWQSAGFILLAIRGDRTVVPLQAIVVQYTVACCRVVVAAHKVCYKTSILRTVSQPTSASDFVEVQRSIGHCGYACRFFQGHHHTGTWVGLAPRSYACDICPVQVKIYERSPALVTKPAGHPGREHARRCSRYGEIVATGDAAHVDCCGKRLTGERWGNQDRERKNNKPVSHCDDLSL